MIPAFKVEELGGKKKSSKFQSRRRDSLNLFPLTKIITAHSGSRQAQILYLAIASDKCSTVCSSTVSGDGTTERARAIFGKLTRASGVLSAWLDLIFEEHKSREHWHLCRWDDHSSTSFWIATFTRSDVPCSQKNRNRLTLPCRQMKREHPTFAKIRRNGKIEE